MKIFITGGCKNGKSFYAQELLSHFDDSTVLNKYYIATMKPCDDEDLARIERHKKERDGLGFITIEQPYNISECLTKCDAASSAMLDSTTALLSNEMFLPDGTLNCSAHKKIVQELILLCQSIKNIVIVSDYIFSDVGFYDELTEAYRSSLAYIDRALAKECDIVCEISYGNKIYHKGDTIL